MKINNPLLSLRLRKNEIEDIISVYEFIKWKDGASSDDGKMATKIIKKLKKHIKEDEEE